MIREYSKTSTRFHKVLDLFLVTFSFVLAYQVRKNIWFWGLTGALPIEPNYYLVLLIIALLAPISFQAVGFYQPYHTQTFFQVGGRVVKAVFGILGGVIIILFLLHEAGVSRMLFGLFGIILAVILLFSKSLLYYTLQHHRAKKYNMRNVLIVGTGTRARRMINSLHGQKKSGYQILGYLVTGNSCNSDIKATEFDNVVNWGAITLLPTILLEQVVDEIIFAADLGDIKFINEYIQFAEELGITIRIVPDFQLEKIMYCPETASVFMQDFAGIPTIALSTLPQKPTELLIKSFIDYVAAGVGLVMLTPIFLIIALAIKCTSKGGIFFLQERNGLYGRVFKMIKFRTMVENAEQLKKSIEHENEVDGPVFKMNYDPRVTGIGRLLRKTSLDELPQLVNVLMGHMSLVGPRPLPVKEKIKKPWQRRRLSMKPGITCIWQVSGRNDIDFDNWMQMDLLYIDNWSLFLDLKLLLKTVKEVVSCHGR